ncbi:PR domain zinc finger protein 8-like isoform X1 [Brienomyrus brachyistius]|uniref:PR domain zinc finger protein 8-like isoform X1 n=2 Tax=Brienomyrus brachyistius TaxID=42636 RepID=UPI0020B2DFCA|nr:PR domain zinc finger protein 8-like isoform X1 [Brienomyrus brachyistius]XP_048860795.1 PR domain zinc finger protein 8-like isoform X1 [Brienomyrus brachyistius]
MEESTTQKLVWDGDAKVVQQCLTDILTSVYTTCDVPENAIFGPCVLSHTSLYDSIAFIALKSTDKRTAPYIFRVDTSTASCPSDGLMWLRLVQSARDKEEQNLEAYVKNGQLFYRSLKRIEKDEELLVWYGKDLINLLLLSFSRAQAKNKGSPPFVCADCNQRFQFEFPFLAHLRFCCTKRLQSIHSLNEDSKHNCEQANMALARSNPKLARSEVSITSQDGKPSMDFHNLARDLENNRTSPTHDKDAEIRSESNNKRKFSDVEENRNGSLSQPFKSKEDLVNSAQQYLGAYALEGNRQAFSHSNLETPEGKRSAFTEVKKALQTLKHSAKNLSSNTENKGSGRPSSGPSEKQLNMRQVLMETQPQCRMESSSLASAFTSVSQPIGSSERKSAFSQPARSFSQLSPLVMTPKLLPPVDCHPSIQDTISSNRLYQPEHLTAKLQSSELGSNCPVPAGIPKQSPFLYATAFWPKTSGPIQLQMTSALTLLPPSFTSLCLPAQNWCAKCNASFRMTSDLVYHMRSHHKKEYALEPLIKRRREEKLKCPICNESFRERHHLSRHMTSHN